jgi:hypothetical protein
MILSGDNPKLDCLHGCAIHLTVLCTEEPAVLLLLHYQASDSEKIGGLQDCRLDD